MSHSCHSEGWTSERKVGMNVKRIVGFLVLALVIFFIITQPESAADAVQSIGATLRNAAESITTFFTELV